MSGNMSAGQIIGLGVGAVAGFFTGGATWYAVAANVAQGAALGYGLGGLIDPPKQPDIQGPRLEDTSVQLATYGASLPRTYNMNGLHGVMVWIENDKLEEVATTKKVGGKGGKKQKQTTFKYYLTCAIAFAVGKTQAVRRIWLSDKLWYDVAVGYIGPPPKQGTTRKAGWVKFNKTIKSGEAAGNFVFHDGDANQAPDDRMMATLGPNCPAFRGITYLTLRDIDMTDYGNSPMGMQVKIELMERGTPVLDGKIAYAQGTGLTLFQNYPPPGNRDPSYYGPYGVNAVDGVIMSGVTQKISSNPDVEATTIWRATLDGQPFSGDIGDTVAVGAYKYGHIGFVGGSPAVYVGTAGAGAIGSWASGYFACKGVTIPRDYTDGFFGGCISSDGMFCGAFVRVSGVNRFRLYDSNMTLLSDQPETVITGSFGNIYFPHLPGGDNSHTMSIENGGKFLWISSLRSGAIGVWAINDDGTLSYIHEWHENYYGSYANTCSIWAKDGVCYGATNGGSIFAYSRHMSYAIALMPLSDIVRAECLLSSQLTVSDLDVTSLTDGVRGYKVTNTAAIRGSLDALRNAYPFDIIPYGYKIKFVRRGLSSMADIYDADLGATQGGDSSTPKLTISRDQASQLPNRVSVTYYDYYREYDPNEQYAERKTDTTDQSRKQDLALSLTADEAAGIAETLLYLNWLERYDLSFVLNAAWTRLLPADVVTLHVDGSTHEVRIVTVNEATDGTVEIGAKYNAAGIYTWKAKGEEGSSTGPEMTISGPTTGVIIDAPAMTSAFDYPGVGVAMKGAYDAWPGGVLEKSADGGQTYDVVLVTAPPSAMIGVCPTALGNAATTRAVDNSQVLQVQTFGNVLSSVTMEQMFAGANHFIVGEPGRWEVIAAMTCTLVSPGIYDLSRLLRGRFGTEWATSTHQAGDTIIGVDEEGAKGFVNMGTNEIGQDRRWRFSTANEDTVSLIRSQTYNAVNLECLSPVQLNATQLPNGDWSIRWVRRTRINGEWRDRVDVPLSETIEAYEVNIYTSTAMTTVKRILASSVQSCLYTVAQQTTDFGGQVRQLSIGAAQLSEFAGQGLLTKGTFNSIYSQVLMDFEQTTPTDTYGHATAFAGTGCVRSNVQKRFDSYSLKGRGSDGWLNLTGLVLGNDPWTIEFSVYMPTNPTNTGNLPVLQLGTVDGGGTQGFVIRTVFSNMYWSYQYYGDGYAGPATFGAWMNIAVMFDGQNIRMRLEGQPASTFWHRDLQGLTDFNVPNTLRIGGGQYLSAVALDAFIDNLKIYSGVPFWNTALPTPEKFTY